MTDTATPSVVIGGRTFLVPEFSIWAQRIVTPKLMKAATRLQNIEDAEVFGELIDIAFECLTIQTKDNKKEGVKVNEITKDEFEQLPMRALHLATDVIPLLLTQAGLQKDDGRPKGGKSVALDTPLPGPDTSTTSSQTSSSPSAENGTPAKG